MRAAFAALLLMAAPAMAQTPDRTTPSHAPDPALRDRGQALIAILDGGSDAGYFDNSFRRAVPAVKLAEVFAAIRATLGRPRAIAAFADVTDRSATLTVRYDRGTATVQIAIDPMPPHQVTGLLVTGTTLAEDSFAAIDKAVATLPGHVAIGVYMLDGAAPEPIYERDAQVATPVGSAFKLWVLAEAVRQVAAGRHRWDDVVPLGPPSLPSGILQRWPVGSPLTLHSLATLMISISDNSAADTLMTVLGRDRIDAAAAAYGGSVPVPTTREIFALKADPARIAAWSRADPASRRAILVTDGAMFARTVLDARIFANGPVAIDTLEWFASPASMARLLNDLRRDPTAAAMLAINPGTDPQTAARFAYIGFKGGSEPGVLALDFVAQTKTGRWVAVTTAWHRSDGAVDEAVLSALAARMLALVADR